MKEGNKELIKILLKEKVRLFKKITGDLIRLKKIEILISQISDRMHT